MGLIANGVRLSSCNPMLQLGAASAGSQDRGNRDNQGSQRNIWAGAAGISSRAGPVVGALHPVTWCMPTKAGYIAARNVHALTVSLAPLAMAQGRNVEGAAPVAWAVPAAALQLVVSAQGSATLSWSTAGALAGALAGAGSASVAWSVPSVTLGAIVSALGAASVSVSANGTARALGWLAGDITPFTELSPQSLSAAVVAALEATTIPVDLQRVRGQALDGTGTSGDPWGPA